MSVDLSKVIVLVPDRFGVTVCDLATLVNRLDETETLTEALTNGGFDTAWGDADVMWTVQKVRKLNADGDVDAYWEAKRPPRHK